ncbi:MAG: hypothetical protein HOV81_13665 [Kofleriaceae bacterium]|nr:hypothetical protein [Kofleriaceae bacterium]
MAPRALGALLALVAALAFAVSIATSAWWAGHPVVDGRPISAKDVHVGLLGAEGCNTGGDGSCEPVEVGATFKLATYGELAIVGLTALLALALAVSAWKVGDRRKGLARTTMTFAILAAAGAGVVLLLGPSIKAGQRVDVPIGWGLYVFGGAIASSLLAGAIARKLEPEPLRLKPGATVSPIVPAPHGDVREMLREQQDGMLHPGSRTSEPRLGQHHGHGHEPPHRESVPLFGSAPQLRPLYDLHNAGVVPAPPQPVLPARAPTPLPYQAVKELTGMPTPQPVNRPNGSPDPFAQTAPAPALRADSAIEPPAPPSRPAPPTRPPQSAPPPRASSSTNPPPFANAPPARPDTSTYPPPRANSSTNPPPSSSSSFAPPNPPTNPPPYAGAPTNPSARPSTSTYPPPRPNSSTHPPPSSSSSFAPPNPPPLASSSASFPARPNTPATPGRPKPLSMPPTPPKASPTPPPGPKTGTPPPGGRTAIMGAVPPPAIEAVPARGGKKVTVPPPARNTPAPRASHPTLAHAVPPMPSADQPAPAERGERATTEADDRLETGMRETEAFDAVGESTDIGLAPAPPSADEPVDATDQTKAPENMLERNPKAATPIAPAPVAAEAPKIPITTAPSTLPPPKKVTETTSGPTPACPQCEAPMAWVEEHLRFYCKSCRMYF